MSGAPMSARTATTATTGMAATTRGRRWCVTSTGATPIATAGGTTTGAGEATAGMTGAGTTTAGTAAGKAITTTTGADPALNSGAERPLAFGGAQRHAGPGQTGLQPWILPMRTA